MKKIIFTILLLLFSFGANASQLPRFLGNEKKFRIYVYNPNDVYRYIGHYSYQGFVEFDDDETISTISMGNPELWLFEHLGNRLFLKPIADKADTNMTVITNKKIYQFELTAREAKGIDDKDLIFVVKFVYPDEKDKNILEFPKAPVSDEPDMRNLSIYNFNYELTGEPSIAPVKIFDNGEFTYFQFSKKSGDLPAIFSVDSSGFESLVNFRAAGDYLIVERVAPQFTLRNGNDIVCVYNNMLMRSGKPVPGSKDQDKKAVAPAAPTSPIAIHNYAPLGASPALGSADRQAQ
jgi:type IV secretion system protein VirB9